MAKFLKNKGEPKHIEEEKPKDLELANTSFYSNNFTFNIMGNEVHIDFQRISPRYVLKTDGTTDSYNVKEHSTIILSISLFKDLIVIASQQIKALEEKFGEITPPEFIKNLTADQQKAIEAAKKQAERGNKDEAPNYLG